MSFISESQLSHYRRGIEFFSQENFVSLNESSNLNINKPMVFLSHKHEENIILQDVIAFLKKEGVDVYVDWMDDKMPAYTNAETAIQLKQKIKLANKFILIATSEAINSKWCNWELGLGDAEKFIGENIALLPINKDKQSFQGAEYLDIYPYIDYQDGSNISTSGKVISKGYYVKTTIKPNSFKITTLKKWLKS